MIKLQNINMSFRGKQILQDINLEVTKGETMVIIGPSGSGKSTILRLIIGLLQPTSGEIWVKRGAILPFARAGRPAACFRRGYCVKAAASARILRSGRHDIRDGNTVHGYRWLARFRSPACFALRAL